MRSSVSKYREETEKCTVTITCFSVYIYNNISMQTSQYHTLASYYLRTN